MTSVQAERATAFLSSTRMGSLRESDIVTPMERNLSLEDLARHTGESVDALRRWLDLGLIGVDTPGRFGHEDIERVRLVRIFLLRGIALEDIARSCREGDLSALVPWYLDTVFPGAGRPALTLEEAAEAVGIDLDQAHRLWESTMMGKHTHILSLDDLEALRTMHRALGAGLPEEALLQMSRTWTETLGRAAEVASRLVHFYVHERPAGGAPALERTMQSDLMPLLEPSILYYLRKGMVRAVPGDMLLHLEAESGRRRLGPVHGRLPLAVLFTDLSSFTPLAEAMGDVKAAEILERFAAIVREAVNRHAGQIVKQLGDGFMIIFHNPVDAVRFALDVEATTGREPYFPASRAGLHWGEALYREGDYIGAAVNLAARVATEAGRHQVLLTRAARQQMGEMPDVTFERLGPRALKGVRETVELFAAHPGVPAEVEKVIDPVCGMELGSGEVAASITMGGKDFAFCSQDCLRRFVDAPQRYGASAS
jgi:adenylate cyclase